MHPPSELAADTGRCAARPGLAQQWGLSWRCPPLRAWPPDGHLALALVLALPVWTALGMLAGPFMYVPSGWAAWFSFVVAYPVMEEVLFRGILQGEVLRLTTRNGKALRMGAVTWANLLASAAFVALHLRAQPLAWALAVAVPSLVFGDLRDRFHSVCPPIFVHAIYNAGFGVAAWLASG